MVVLTFDQPVGGLIRPPNETSTRPLRTRRIMSKEKSNLKPAQIAAGALAAVTAAYLGSKLNVAGTVAGAAVASIVSTIGATLYERSIERTRESVRKVGSKAWVVRADKPGEPAEIDESDAVEPDADQQAAAEEPKPVRTVRWPVVVAGSVLAFVLGMLAITGVEWLRGAPLSGGDQGTTLGWIAGKPTDNPSHVPEDTSTPPPSSTTTTPPASATTTPPSTTSSAPTTTTDSGIPTTSSAPPTTTGQSPPPTAAQTTPVPTTGP